MPLFAIKIRHHSNTSRGTRKAVRYFNFESVRCVPKLGCKWRGQKILFLVSDEEATKMD